MSAYAWSEDDSPEVESAPLRPFLITSAAVGVSLCLVAVAGVLGYRWATDEAPAPAALSAPMATTVAPITKAAPPPPPAPPAVTVTTVVVESKVAAPPAPPPRPTPVMSTWTYDVNWGGAPVLAVVEHGGGAQQTQYINAGGAIGTGTGWPGDLIGVDPVIDGPITWAGCRLYIDGRLVMSDSATRGDGHDVSCLMRIPR